MIIIGFPTTGKSNFIQRSGLKCIDLDYGFFKTSMDKKDRSTMEKSFCKLINRYLDLGYNVFTNDVYLLPHLRKHLEDKEQEIVVVLPYSYRDVKYRLETRNEEYDFYRMICDRGDDIINEWKQEALAYGASVIILSENGFLSDVVVSTIALKSNDSSQVIELSGGEMEGVYLYNFQILEDSELNIPIKLRIITGTDEVINNPTPEDRTYTVSDEWLISFDNAYVATRKLIDNMAHLLWHIQRQGLKMTDVCDEKAESLEQAKKFYIGRLKNIELISKYFYDSIFKIINEVVDYE